MIFTWISRRTNSLSVAAKASLSLSLGLTLGLISPLCSAAEPEKKAESTAADLPVAERLKFGDPNLVVDLGVGLWAWPLPMDWDGDGDIDLVVSCPDYPYAGTYFFENPGLSTAAGKMPVMKKAVKVGPKLSNATSSFIDGKVSVRSPGKEYVDFRKNGFSKTVTLLPKTNIHPNKVRANQWRAVDYDGDGAVDLIVGVGDWTDYGWDDGFNRLGIWTRGPLHGYVYFVKNTATTEKPKYAEPVKLTAAGAPIDVFGAPSPNFGDFDGDGDLDLICGEFLDGFSYFENIGTRTQPQYASPRRLKSQGQELHMDLEMIIPVAIDWDGDGDLDLIVGDEDGRVAFMEHTGQVVDQMPVFLPPRYFRQEADDLKFGALASPYAVDWDGDGDEDLISGNTAGYVAFIENLDGGNPPRWAEPKLLESDGEILRIMAGPNGSIQGPCEAKWGYTTLSATDWDADGLPDLVVNSIWGKVLWYKNVGTRQQPVLGPAQSVEVDWPEGSTALKPAWNWWNPQGKELVTQWRTTPVVFDWNRDGLPDLIMLDHEGYLTYFERKKTDTGLILKPGKRIFVGTDGEPLRLNPGYAGKSGRRKLCLTDWDGDGKVDLLINGKNVDFWKNQSTSNEVCVFELKGPVSSMVLAGHDTSPTPVNWSGTGIPDLVIGAEDGRFYLVRNPRQKPSATGK